MVRSLIAAAMLMVLCPGTAHAEVAGKSEIGFVTTSSVDIPGKPPADVWQALLKPAKWWNPLHSWSGDAENLYLDGQAGGCFCELLPLPGDAAPGTRRGSIEHARVIAAMPPRLLRLAGALGPLQGEALNGTLTVVLKPLAGGGTGMAWSYVVGGYMRMKVEDIAPIVDRVLAEQAARLAAFVQAPPADQPGAPSR